MNSSLSSPEGIYRIAIFLPSLNGGGAERVMVTLANAFAARGYDVDLVLSSAEGPYLSQVSDAVRIVNFRVGRVVMAFRPLVQYMRRERPHVMLSSMTHANVVAILAKMFARVSTRLVVSERTTISFEVKRAKKIAGRMTYFLIPRLYTRADSIVAVSQLSAADLIEFSGLPTSCVKVIYNPFNLNRIQKLASEPLEHRWFAPGQPLVILACGRLSEAKDYPTLIHAFKKIRQIRPARLLILGEGELRSSLEALVAKCGFTADDVQMPGFVANPYAYMSRCGVFVLSSRWEGLPGVLIEAMACGASVVSTNCPSGPNEILEGGRWGALVPVGDPDSLSNAVVSVLSSSRSQLPDVQSRASDFEQDKAVDEYLRTLGLPPSVY